MKLKALILALIASIVFAFSSALPAVQAASGYLTNCVTNHGPTWGDSICLSVIADPSYNGLQRVRITCFNGVTYVSVYGPYVLKGYYSTAYCASGYSEVAGFETVQRL